MIARDIRQYLIAAALAALVLSVYWQVGDHAFVNIDDQAYVTENSYVLRGLTRESVSWALTTFHAGNWHPLTWLSHMVDVELFGSSPAWHHLTNVLLHLLNTELLFLVLWRMTGGFWQSAFVAVLFGIHPLHVESVAWVSERKDVLSTLFWILTMGAYLRYVRHPTVGRYLLVVGLFTLGLMCKPMLVTLPFVLLLLDWWPLNRVTGEELTNPTSSWYSLREVHRFVWEKLPLFALSTAACVVTYTAQAKSGAVLALDHIPFVPRVSNALISSATYLLKMAWPSSLAVFYPHPWLARATVPVWHVFGSALLITGTSCLALWQGRRRPYIATGWLWYLGTLVPVIGLVQVGDLAMADRYTYIPLLGIFIVVAWGIPSISAGHHFRRLVTGVSVVAVVALSAAAWHQASYWRDSITLLSRTLAVTERNWLAWNNLGGEYVLRGKFQEGIGCFLEVLKIRPNDVRAWSNLGAAYNGLGQFQLAIAHYREALRLRPDFAQAWFNLGVAYNNLGQLDKAIDCYKEAVRIQPGYVSAWNSLREANEKRGQFR